MKLVLAILITLLVDWLGAFLISYNKKKNLKRDEDLFNFKLEQLLKDKNVPLTERIFKSKELCRNTKGKIAAGSYFALDFIQYDINKLSANK